jgi:hypothetical protein
MKADILIAHFERLTRAQLSELPAHERVLDRLADLLFDADEVLDMLRADDAKSIRWLEPHLQIVYDELNGVMKKLCD